MKFHKLFVFGAALALAAPSAFATSLYGSFSVSGTATITGVVNYPNDYVTNIAFGALNTTNTNQHFDQSKGGFIDSDGDNFNLFDSSAAVYFVPGATSTHKTGNAYDQRSPASLAVQAPSVANGGQTNDVNDDGPDVVGYDNYTFAPVQFMTVKEGTDTLVFYLTEIDSTSLGTARVNTGPTANRHPATTGSITGVGYVTLNRTSMTYGDFSLINNSSGAGAKAFSASFTAFSPEPGSLALMGTGLLGTAGFAIRRRRSL